MTRRPANQDTCAQVRIPAKVNLFLAVRGRRPDGFHEIVTVLQTVSVYDRMTVLLHGPPGQGHHPAARRRMRLVLRQSEVDGLPPPADNLAMRAARALGEAAGVIEVDGIGDGDRNANDGPSTVLELDKGIPIAGGMAGGSADAAGALVALNELWGCRLGRAALRKVAADLGSDVPFCLEGGTALATGRGEAVAQVLCRGTFHWVVCTVRRPLATAEVYAAWDRFCRPSVVEPDAVLQALRSVDAEALGAALHNDLQEPAFRLRPELRDHRDALRKAGALGAVLSGSGPTLLALAGSEREARDLAERVRDRFDGVTVARSPVGGPDLRPC